MAICASGWAQSTQPAQTLDQIKQQVRMTDTAKWSTYSLISPRPIQDVIAFSFDGGHLVADSKLDWDGQYHRVQLTGFPGEATIFIQPGKTNGTCFANFEYYDYSDPHLVSRHLQSLPGPTSVQIDEDLQYTDRIQFVALISDQDKITLRVQVTPDDELPPLVSDPATRPAVESLNLVDVAANFAELRQEHPADVDRYIRPMFRDFHQEREIFAVDEKSAWQVMANTFSAPPDLAKRVDAIVARVGDDSYSIRTSASNDLVALGEPAALYLMANNLRLLNPEQRARVEEFLSTYHPLTPEQVAQDRRDVNFLLDCLDSDNADLRTATLREISQTVGHAVDFDIAMPADSRSAAIDRLRSELTGPTTQP
jgi:hypothetical protein